MARHLSDEELLRARLAAADDPSRERVRAHLASGCARCIERMAQIETLMAAFSAPALPEVPEAWLAKAAQWIADQERQNTTPEERPSLVERLGTRLEEIRAALVMDSAAGAVMAGIRAAGPSRERQLLFESAAGNVLLQIEPTGPNGFSMRGQFLPQEDIGAVEDARARLAGGDSSREQVSRLSPTGEFSFPKVRGEEIRLTIEWRDRRIALDPVVIGKTADG